MRQEHKKLLLAAVLYVGIGIFYQALLCTAWWSQLGSDGIPSDIPCAGILWTPIVLLQWPLMGFFSLMYGDFSRGIPVVLAFILILLVLVKFPKKQVS
ncbi:MAG: hypothetical protein AAB515_02580 [Patescibacteria group bacterium]